MSVGYFYNIVFLFITCCVWFASRYFYPTKRRIVRLFVFFWLVNSLIIALNFITYDVLFTLKTFVYLTSFFLFGVLGLYLGSNGFITNHKVDPQNIKPFNPRSMVLMLSLSSIFLFYGYFDVMQKIPMMISDFGALRASFWDEWLSVKEYSTWDAVLAFLQGVSFFTFLSYCSPNTNTSSWLRVFAFSIAFLFVVQVLLIGGRSLIFYVVFATLYLFSLFDIKPNRTSYVNNIKKIFQYYTVMLS